MFSKIHEECGVFGIYTGGGTDVAGLTYSALFALQHRGQESCGIAVNDDGVISGYKDLGLVGEVFPPERLQKLGGGPAGGGSCPLRHHRQEEPRKRPAPDHQSYQGQHGARPQRQPDKRRRVAGGTGAQRQRYSTPPATPRSLPIPSPTSVCGPPPSRRRSLPPWTGSRARTRWSSCRPRN